ncbi:MAG: HupE/UreJ family protein [Flavobacteriaceae bacterium]|nr:HupE/UreJ family protein [Flavobacteriaceae bacterium]MCY4268352.1 HupE/UreJ family protein [Flavobacteriaceae bacterium]MCY4299201.1 HupE/UreJ family protein [Flavobacteriaceae bacterium]
MIDKLFFFLKLGFNHVLDFTALDHVLFLVVMALPFSLKHWKDLIIIVSIFTIGHSVSMLVVYMGLYPHSMNWIELMISLSIVLVATKNIFTNKKSTRTYDRKWFYWLVTLFFGLIHGFGFGSFFRQASDQGEAFVTLVGFAFGVEVAQLMVVGIVVLLNYILIQRIKVVEFFWLLFVSSIVLIEATRMVIRNIMEL